MTKTNIVSFSYYHDQKNKLQELADEITHSSKYLEDRYQIAALLESMGWTDDLAYKTFGVEDVFALAAEVWELIQQRVAVSPYSPQEKGQAWHMFLELLKSFLRGMIFALPMSISVLAMITLKFSLWSYEYFTLELATSIAIGTILSFITVGGFTQAIARRGFFYLYQGYYNMGRQITFFFIRWGYIFCIAMCCFIYLFNFVFNIYPQNMFVYIALYFFFLNSIWLSVTVMYILRRELTFTGLIIAGIGLVYILKTWVGLDIIRSQLFAIFLVSGIGMALSLYYFKHEEKKGERGIAPKLPRVSYTVYAVLPYFAYGFLYFLFLYIDRVVAWSTNQEYMPYFIWFRGDYELGLDYALLVLIIPLGFSEVLLNKFMLDIEVFQKRFWAFETDKMNQTFLTKYYRILFVIITISVVSAIVTIFFLLYLNQRYYEVAGKYLITGHVTYFTLFVSCIGYVILAIGLMNAVILFALSQPHFINRVLILAILANMGIGFVLSRWVHYSWAVFGLLAGSILFSVLSTKQVRNIIVKLDYYLYAAS
ncbi:hypothetical protein LSG31_13990 [Fodinisporobacter ferrooxydans]|uniref:Uncharacterized protein n=1 Tax=Fodinisporobacter ferrooxydans TaxID=2901836 RepID=A0ABY4CF93_9BACL|nr:hypothetical protein LSG31_13990 [Alicyclobacillaceae bacterium MYW30-H2]